MGWQFYVSVVVMASPFAYLLGQILGTLTACHKELVRIRLATVSLHDNVVPEVATRRLMRKWGWVRQH